MLTKGRPTPNFGLSSVGDWATEFARIRAVWSLFDWLKPLPENAAREKAAFFAARTAGRRHEPRLRYDPHDDQQLDFDAAFLKGVPPPSGFIGSLLEEERQFLLTQLEMISARGDPAAFTALSLKAFGAPTDDHVVEAREALRHVPPDLPERQWSAQQLAAMARQHLESLGIIGWRVNLVPGLVSIMKVDTARRLIELRSDFTFGAVDEISLLRHEIEGHVRRAENGFALGYEFLGQGVGSETELDEGIACHFEDLHGGLVGRRHQELAARVLAVDAALRAGFCEVYDLIESVAPGIGPELTYQLVLRVKRGLEDTGEPGAWTKDALYFTGLSKVRAYLAEHGEAKGTSDLMVARVSWHGLPAALKMQRRAQRRQG